jgi:hypothetical protein
MNRDTNHNIKRLRRPAAMNRDDRQKETKRKI